MKHLLPQKIYYKANLHTHSTVSDGELTPEELRDAYKALGYSILAITDHSVMVQHQDLNQEDFLMLTGTEVEIEDLEGAKWKNLGRERHYCLIAKDPYHLWIPFRDPNPVPRSIPYEALDEVGGMNREYTHEFFNTLVAECNRQGYLVTYNHPQWSRESYPDYIPQEGLWGMEYRNAGSVALGFEENNGIVFEDFLRAGKFMVPLFTDDLHRVVRNGYRVIGDSWVMIGADSLNYGDVIDAMERGDLYASCGPEIHSVTWDEGKLKVCCSGVSRIQLLTHTFCTKHLAVPKGETLTEGEFDMSYWWDVCKGQENGFLRLILTAEDGTYAVTRAYRMEDLV